MSVLVGDAVMAVRSIIPDMPGTLPPPTLSAFSLSVVATTSTLPAATYYLRFSVTTNWGESTLSSESTGQIVTSGHGIQITGSLPLGAATLRVYFGTTLGGENQFIDITTFPYTITTVGTPGTLPIINRAYLPDTDGTMYPAVTIYGWLRDGLKLAADNIGGIYDATGVNTTDGNAMYQLYGSWKQLTHSWVDGWIYEIGNKREIFYRNKVTTDGGGIVVQDVRGVNTIIEYYPIPDRTGGQTTLTGNISATATNLACTTLGGFELEYGLALIGTEIVAYQSLSGSTLSGCLRGLGGTQAQAWPSTTPVLELNGRFAGYRYPTLPVVGQSANVLDVPPSWDVPLQYYILSRYREAERRFKESADWLKTFTGLCKTAQRSANRASLQPKQVGDTFVNEVYNAGLGGGWLLP